MASCTATQPKITQHQQKPNERIIQNHLIVWLDENINENDDDHRNSITKLREIMNSVYTFTSIDQCVAFINEIKGKEVFMISSGTLGQTAVPIVHQLPHISAIYIFCGDKKRHQQWTAQWSKIKGVFTNITPICEALQKAVQECDPNTISMSFISANDNLESKNLDQLDQSFMYTQILKEILLKIKFRQKHFEKFITYCREKLKQADSYAVNEMEEEYDQDNAIWWYTHPCFLHDTLNLALRTMDVEFIVHLGFFMQDLHKHITQVHSEQYPRDHQLKPFPVYRGQRMNHADFNKLKKTKGGLLSFNNFLSTSKKPNVSLDFARDIVIGTEFVRLLFVMNVDPSIQSTPFAYIEELTDVKGEHEVLFSMHSIFRIGQIQQIEGEKEIWQVDLTLTGDQDPELHALTKHIREETFPRAEGWYRLARFLRTIGQPDQAEKVYNVLLEQATEESKKAKIYHEIGGAKDAQGEYTEAMKFYKKALAIEEKHFPPNHPSLAISYCNIGGVYDNMGKYSKALYFHKRALAIEEDTLRANHQDLATSYCNIAAVHDHLGEYSEALSFFEKARVIDEKTLTSNHPSLAITYSNIGGTHDNLGNYLEALSFHKRALVIKEKTLPPNHPSLASSYCNIGRVYDEMGEYSQALSYHKKALAIFEKALASDHPSLATSYCNIGRVYDQMADYSEALSFHQKALTIFEKTLSSNHSSLASAHSNLGRVYDNLGMYSQALSYHQKALTIFEKALPSGHPSLATSCSNIGRVYDEMGDYSQALSFHQKALTIFEKALPSNHPSLASTHSNFGRVYDNMHEYSEALSSHKKALAIFEKALSSNHPSLGTSYCSIGRVYDEVGDYSQALSFHEKALSIKERALPSGHPHLAISYDGIGKVYYHMGDYQKALSFYEKTLQIGEQSLSSNHPKLAWYYNDIGMVYSKKKDYSKALSFYKRALEIGKHSLPATHPHLELYRSNLKSVPK